MEKHDDAPKDVKRATPVEREIRKGQKDDTFEGYPRIVEKKKRWEHCDDKPPSKKFKQAAKSNGDCCQERRESRRKREKFAMISVFEKPCTFPKLEIVPRHCLTKQKYIDMLATPSRKCPPDCHKKTVLRKLKPISPRLKELALPTRQRMLMALQHGAATLPPALLDNLVRTLENETCLTPEQAAVVSRKRKFGKKDKRRKSKGEFKETGRTGKTGKTGKAGKTGKSGKSSVGVTSTGSTFDKDSAACQYLTAERFVRSILKWKCSVPKPELNDISEVIVGRLVDILEYTPPQTEDRKSQQLRFLADVIACWVTGVLFEVAENQERKLTERCQKKEEEMKADEETSEDQEEEEEKDVDEKGDDDDDDYDDDDDDDVDVDDDEDEEKDVKEMDKYDGDKEGKGKEKLEIESKEERERVTEDAEEDQADTEEERTESLLGIADAEEISETEKKEMTETEITEVEEYDGTVETETETEREIEAKDIDAGEEATVDKGGQDEAIGDGEVEVDLEAVEEKVKGEEQTTTEAMPTETEGSVDTEMEMEAVVEVEGKSESEIKELPTEEIKDETEKSVIEVTGKEEEEQEEEKEKEKAIENEEEEEEEEKEKKDEIERVESKKESSLSALEVKVVAETEMEVPKDVKKDLAELFETDLPFLTFGTIIDTIYKMIEDTPENTGEDPITNGIHRAIHEKLNNIVMLENPELLTEELRNVMDVVCGKIANWLRSILSKSQLAFMKQFVPEIESKEIRDWTKWLAYISDVANDWNLWLRGVIGKMFEMESAPITRGEWQDWTKSVDAKALLWRRFHRQIRQEAHRNVTMITGRRVVKTAAKRLEISADPSEQLLLSTDLHASNTN